MRGGRHETSLVMLIANATKEDADTHTLIIGQILQKLRFTNTAVLMGGANSTYSQWWNSKCRFLESQKD